jgi:hypothetical protein
MLIELLLPLQTFQLYHRGYLSSDVTAQGSQPCEGFYVRSGTKYA